MIDELRWINISHGMELHADINDGIRKNENGILFLCEYYFLKYELNQLTQADVETFRQIVENLRTYRSDGINRYLGLYDRGSGESLIISKDKLRTISHDNISAIVAFSDLFGLPYAKAVFEHGKANFWRFDNVYPEAPRWSRIMHPRDIIFWSRLGGRPIGKAIAWLFMWFFYLALMVSILNKKGSDGTIHTSGPLLVFVRLFPLRRKSIIARGFWWLCCKLRDYKFTFDYYYKDPEHPNRKLAAEVFHSK